MSKIWFKAKRYGWGWYPASWQGWLVIILYVFLLFRILANTSTASKALSSSALSIFLLTMFLVVISYVKGEKPGWRWGGKKEEDRIKNTE